MGPEIWQQTEGRVTHFVAGAGTGGTVSGAGKYLKEKNPKIRVIAGDPVGSLYTHYHHTRTMGDGHAVQGGGDRRRQDPHHACGSTGSTSSAKRRDQTSFMMARRLAREEGTPRSAARRGSTWRWPLDLARELNDPDALIVTILCDTGERYLSKQFNDAWMQENQMLETPADHGPGAARAPAGRTRRRW